MPERTEVRQPTIGDMRAALRVATDLCAALDQVTGSTEWTADFIPEIDQLADLYALYGEGA